jgi:hypothetical protein
MWGLDLIPLGLQFPETNRLMSLEELTTMAESRRHLLTRHGPSKSEARDYIS